MHHSDDLRVTTTSHTQTISEPLSLSSIFFLQMFSLNSSICYIIPKYLFYQRFAWAKNQEMGSFLWKFKPWCGPYSILMLLGINFGVWWFFIFLFWIIYVFKLKIVYSNFGLIQYIYVPVCLILIYIYFFFLYIVSEFIPPIEIVNIKRRLQN